ncbi:MAG: PAS domain S-box protein [Deltaproteobacteria bacterium]|nr:PAS domain S-box protein [Deltaproteobacteria bacterium]
MNYERMKKTELVAELKRLRNAGAGPPTSAAGVDSDRKELYSNFFEESRDAIIIAGRNGKFIDFNQSALDLFGYTREEMMKMSVRDFYIHPSDRARFLKEIEKDGAVTDFNVELRNRDGRPMDCLVNMTVKKSAEGVILGYQGIIRDITEQKQAEKLYNVFANSSQTGVYIIQDGTFKFANPHVLSYSRYHKMEDLLKVDPLSMVHPDDRDRVRENAVSMLKGEKKTPYEYRLITKDGTTRWILETVTSMEYYGRCAAMGSSMDITATRIAQEKLDEMKQLESSILAAIPHAVIGLENRRIIFANDAVEKVFGWKPSELIGKLTRTFYRSDEDFEEIARRVYPVLEEQSTCSEEFPCRRKDGTDIVCRINTSKVGDILREKRIVVVYEDITERKHAEEALRESEEKYSAVVEQAMDGVVIIQDDVYKFANKAMAVMSGYAVRELVGKHYLDIFVPSCRDKFSKVYRMHMAGKKVLPVHEAKLLCRDGSQKDIEIALGIIKLNENPADMWYVRDITARKRAQEELKKSFEKLQKRMEETVSALASITEKRDPYTAGHQQRVAQLACAIAREMDLPEAQIEGIMVAATLHDIGKIYEPSEILSKPGILTEIEFLMMKVHPQIGYDILKNIDFPWPVAQIVLQHHEKLDGSGYPKGISGDDILLEARIIAVADVVEAMASHRPYRSALGIDAALEEISEQRGTFYDPAVVDACLKLFRKRNFEFDFTPPSEARRLQKQ